MAKTSVEIDVDKLNRARETLGTETIQDTIDAAFRQVIKRAAVRDLVALAGEGAFAALLEPSVEARLWG